MQVEVETLPVEQDVMPAVIKLIADCESQLSMVCGSVVKVKVEFPNYRPTKDIEKENKINILRLAVCNHLSVTWEQIAGKSRKEKYKHARHVYWYLSSFRLGRGCKELGRETGHNHATIINAKKSVRRLLDAKDQKYINSLKEVEQIIDHV